MRFNGLGWLRPASKKQKSRPPFACLPRQANTAKVSHPGRLLSQVSANIQRWVLAYVTQQFNETMGHPPRDGVNNLFGVKPIQRRFAASLCAFLLIVGSKDVARSIPQTGRKSLPTPTLDQILDRYELAVGGHKAWDKLTSRIMKATMVFSGSAQTGHVEVYQQLPNKYLNVTVLPSEAKTELGFNGEVAWSKDSVHGARRLTGLQLEMIKHTAGFNEVFSLREAFPHMEVLGSRMEKGRTTYVVQTTTAEGYTGTMYFDAQTGLRVRITSTGANGQNYDDYIEEYCDLKDVGIKYPCRRRQVWPKFVVTVQVTEILHNVSIDALLFVPPSTEYKIQH